VLIVSKITSKQVVAPVRQVQPAIKIDAIHRKCGFLVKPFDRQSFLDLR